MNANSRWRANFCHKIRSPWRIFEIENFLFFDATLSVFESNLVWNNTLSWNLSWKMSLYWNLSWKMSLYWNLSRKFHSKKNSDYISDLTTSLLVTSWSLPGSLLGIFVVSYFFLSFFLSFFPSLFLCLSFLCQSISPINSFANLSLPLFLRLEIFALPAGHYIGD